MDRATRSAAYDNGAAVADSAARIAAWAARSLAVRDNPVAVRDLACGPKPRNSIDVLACGRPEAPVDLAG